MILQKLNESAVPDGERLCGRLKCRWCMGSGMRFIVLRSEGLTIMETLFIWMFQFIAVQNVEGKLLSGKIFARIAAQRWIWRDRDVSICTA